MRLFLMALAMAAVLPAGAPHAQDAEAHRLVEAGLRRAADAPRPAQGRAATCQLTGQLSGWPLTLSADGQSVLRAQLVQEIEGFAAGTRGGEGGKLYRVTTPADYLPGREPAIEGSLRHAIDSARRQKQPAWIAIDSRLAGQSIILKAPLRPASNMTLDATCAGVTLEAAPEITLMAVREVSNLVIAGFQLKKTAYSGENKGRDDGKDFRDCITIAGRVDGVGILYNTFGACGDGQIDITSGVGKAMPQGGGRISIAFNRFLKHDKAMLIGTYGCQDHSTSVEQGCDLPGAGNGPPSYRVTLLGNAFLWTGQRNPRAFGRVEVELYNNIFAFEPYDRGNGSSGSSYGQYVSNGATLRAVGNVYLSGAPEKARLGLYSPSTPGALAGAKDTEGRVSARDNLRTGSVVIDERGSSAQTAPTGALIGAPAVVQPRHVNIAKFSVENAVACIAARAGVKGERGWNPTLCELANSPRSGQK